MGNTINISTRILIDAPAEQVWDVIGPGFTRIGEWVSAIGASRPVDGKGPDGAPAAGRTCRVASTGFDQIAEELTSYDPAARQLSYRASDGMPSFVIHAANTWQARPIGDHQTEFTMDAEISLTGAGRAAAPLLRAYLSRVMRSTAVDLKVRVETGTPSRAKTIQIHVGQRTRLDRLVTANALFSATSGAALTLASGWWSRQLGDPGNEPITAIGLGLVGYAVLLAWTSGRGLTGENGRLIAALDAAWVFATLAVLGLTGSTLFTTTGMTAAILASFIVANLGLLQWRAALRLDTERTVPSAESAPRGARRATRRPIPKTQGPIAT